MRKLPFQFPAYLHSSCGLELGWGTCRGMSVFGGGPFKEDTIALVQGSWIIPYISFNWVAASELKVAYYGKEPLFFTTYPYDGTLI